MQAAQLQHQEESQKRSRQVGNQQALSVLPQTHQAQRNQVGGSMAKDKNKALTDNGETALSDKEKKIAAKAAEKQKRLNELKSKQAATSKKPKRTIRKFFKDTKSEFSKVVWPKRRQVFNGTVIVLTSIVGVSIAVFALDSAFSFILRLLLQM
jgi:preprotein translocase subunit SecE